MRTRDTDVLAQGSFVALAAALAASSLWVVGYGLWVVVGRAVRQGLVGFAVILRQLR